MLFEDLTPGERFNIDGAYYEVKSIYGRIVMCYVLQNIEVRGYCDEVLPDLARIPDPQDLTGYEYLTTLFSDLRVNANNATPDELEYLKNLKLLI